MEPKAAFNTLQCIRRHHWYLTGPMVALALADRGLEDEEREELARKLYHTPRGQVKSGRPTFPVLEWVGEELARPRLATLITTCTWLIFHKLQLTGSQVRGRELECNPRSGSSCPAPPGTSSPTTSGWRSSPGTCR